MKQSLILGIVVTIVMSVSVVNAEVNVVATLPSIAAIAKDIGGKHVQVKALSSASQDPHYVDPRPNLLVALSRADLLLLNGMELEIGWLPPLMVNARNAKIQQGSDGYLDVSTAVNRLNVRGAVSRAQGDIHAAGNPHFMADPRAGIAVASLVSQRLAKIDPNNSEAYQANFRRFEATMRKIAVTEAARFGKIPAEDRHLVVYHDSWTYLVQWLQLTQVATVEPKPGIMPTPGHVAKVLGLMRKRKTKVLIQESYYPAKTSKNLAKLARAKLVVLAGGVDFAGGETYEAYVQRIASQVFEALQ